MPYDGAGVFSLVNGYLAVNGQPILPSNHNPPLQDIASGLGQVLLRSGVAPMTGNIAMTGNKITGLANGTNDDDAATVGQAALQIGDFKGSYRTLDSNFLRRDGSIYPIASYPALAALLPALPDGISWTTITGGFASTPTCIYRGPTGFVVGTNNNTDSKIYLSPDGEAPWTLQATITGFVIADITRGAGVYVAVDANGKSSSSSNLTSWTTPVFAIGSGADFCTSVAFGAGVFFTVGTAAKAASSPDGVTWTARTLTTAKLNRVRFVNSLFVAVGNAGAMMTTPSGVGSFTNRTTGTTNNLQGVTFGNSLYVIAGDTGIIRTTPDLVNFTTRTSSTTANFQDVVYSTSGFVAVASTGIVRISGASDGTTWASSATGVSTGFLMAAFDTTNQYKYFLVGSGSTDVLKGIRTLPTQFQLTNDGPYQWVKAL